MVTRWQTTLLRQTQVALAGVGSTEPYGSYLTLGQLDGWSDLDLSVELSEPISFDRLGLDPPWAWQDSVSAEKQTLRIVLPDGRRLDLSVRGATISMPHPGPDNAIRFEAALAATRFGRGDRLIGMHLTMGILRECLVVAMLLRDRAEGTDRHRHGSELDRRAGEVGRIAAQSTEADQRPTIVEHSCRLYGDWRSELHPDYHPDWSGLTAVIDLGADSVIDR